MLRARLIPALLLRDERLVKTERFGKFIYIGDPCNTVRIFNELEVDELVFLDITATADGRAPNLKVLAEIANECFMPLAYSGGVRTFEHARSILHIGFEKIAVNTRAIEEPRFVRELADHFGDQAIIASIDVKRDRHGKPTVRARGGRVDTGKDPVAWAKELQAQGAGEILLTSIDREGTWQGYDLDLVRSVASAVTIPVIAHGGAGGLKDVGDAVRLAGASAAAVGSMVVFQKRGMGVLVNFPSHQQIAAVLGGRAM